MKATVECKDKDGKLGKQINASNAKKGKKNQWKTK